MISECVTKWNLLIDVASRVFSKIKKKEIRIISDLSFRRERNKKYWYLSVGFEIRQSATDYHRRGKGDGP
jgi:hypothetical protein